MIWMTSIVLAVMLTEACVFALFGRRIGLPPAEAIGMVLPGAALALALLLVVTGAGIPAVGGALVLAGLGHGYDLQRRRRKSAKSSTHR